MELEILTEAEAATKPVGLGRSPPNALPDPVYVYKCNVSIL